MISTNKTHTLVRSHDFEESEFGIDQEDISFVIDLLRNQIYSNKPLAVIREYSTNAVDAHVELGKGEEPIQVTLPTKFEPTFKVRDLGTGLTDEEIRNLYTRYCKSTKRNSNAFTGQLGIGCKAGFAYGDNFGIVSYNNGTKNTYNAQIDETAKGKVILMDSSPTTKPNGMEIVISVADTDVDTFRKESLNLFRYFKVKPHIYNLGEDKLEEKLVSLKGDFWTLYDDATATSNGYRPRYDYGRSNQTIAIMGNIGYPIRRDSIQHMPSNLQDLLSIDNLEIEFDIGELNIAPSREGLEYTKRTQEAIKKKIKLLKDDLEGIAQEKLGGASDLYEAKCNYASIINSLPYTIQHVLENSFKWNGIKINNARISQVAVDHHSPEMTIRNYWKETDTFNADGYKMKSRMVNTIECHVDNLIGYNDCTSSHGLSLKARTLFKENPDAKNIFMVWFKDDATKKKFYDERDFEHVSDSRINYFSKLEKSPSGYTSKGGTRKASAGSRQHVKVFKLRLDTGHNDQDNWADVETDDAPTEGVYVPILRYKIVDGKQQAESFDTRQLATFIKSIKSICGLEVEVYGVRCKDTEKLDDSNWTHFRSWLKKNIDTIITPKLWQEYADELSYNSISTISFMSCREFVKKAGGLDDSNIIKKAINFLPKHDDGTYSYHSLARVKTLLVALQAMDNIYDGDFVSNNIKQYTAELSAKDVEKAFKLYPMIDLIELYSWRFDEVSATKLVNYIKQIDELTQLQQTDS
jgi:hypothetical protein